MTESTDPIPSIPLPGAVSPLDATRRQFLALGALAGATAVILPALPARAADLGLGAQLKFLESAQYFSSQFFSRALQSGSIEGISPAEGKALLDIANQDSEQARWISAVRAQRGLMPAHPNAPVSLTEPNFAVGGAYGDRAKFFGSALAIKTASVGAFHGIVGSGGKADIVQAIASLAGVQNRHLASLRTMNGADPFDTFVTGISVREASKTLSKYGFDMGAGI